MDCSVFLDVDDAVFCPGAVYFLVFVECTGVVKQTTEMII